MQSPFKSVVPRFPMEFALALRDICKLSAFVETGTYHGDTAVRAAPHFRQVITIEGVWERFDWVNFHDMPNNVTVLYGPSETGLSEALAMINRPSLVFLDAHWIHAGAPIEEDVYQGRLSPCPVLAELAQINMDVPHAILIDDAHFFMHPPRKRGGAGCWPSLDEICGAIHGRYVFIHAGILAAIPDAFREPVQAWLLENWQGWERYIESRIEHHGDVAEMERYQHV